jgi:hypothetical protein
MGYFDGMTNAVFKTDRNGNTVFYPWGVFTRGWILTDPARIAAARHFLRRWYQVSICGAPLVTMAIIPQWIPLPITAALVVACLVIGTGWFVVKTRKLTAGAERSDERLWFRDSLANIATGLSRPTIWILYGVSCLGVMGGLWMAVNMGSRVSAWPGVLVAATFAAGACMYGYMLAVQGRSPPDGR